jgi:hypothetical protein
MTSTSTSTPTPTPSVTQTLTPTTIPVCPYVYDSVNAYGKLVDIANDTYNSYVWVLGKFSATTYDSSFTQISNFGSFTNTPTSISFDPTSDRMFISVQTDLDYVNVITSTS